MQQQQPQEQTGRNSQQHQLQQLQQSTILSAQPQYGQTPGAYYVPPYVPPSTQIISSTDELTTSIRDFHINPAQQPQYGRGHAGTYPNQQQQPLRQSNLYNQQQPGQYPQQQYGQQQSTVVSQQTQHGQGQTGAYPNQQQYLQQSSHYNQQQSGQYSQQQYGQGQTGAYPNQQPQQQQYLQQSSHYNQQQPGQYPQQQYGQQQSLQQSTAASQQSQYGQGQAGVYPNQQPQQQQYLQQSTHYNQQQPQSGVQYAQQQQYGRQQYMQRKKKSLSYIPPNITHTLIDVENLLEMVRSLRKSSYTEKNQEKMIEWNNTRAQKQNAWKMSIGNDNPLLQNISNGNIEAVEKLIQANMSLDQGDSNLNRASLATAMSCSCQSVCNHFAIAKLLIDNGADVNIIDKLGDTPVYLAVSQQMSNPILQQEQLKILMKILECGGNADNMKEDNDRLSWNYNKVRPIWEWPLRLDKPAQFAAIVKFANDFQMCNLTTDLLYKPTQTNRNYASVITDALKTADTVSL